MNFTYSGGALVFDANLTAANIKKGVEILGVTGTHSGVVYDDATGQDPVALVSSVPADGGYDVAVDATIVLTFNNQIASEEIVIAYPMGYLTFAKEFDATGKILTITPASNFENDDFILIHIIGVKDIYGQELAPSLLDFSVVS